MISKLACHFLLTVTILLFGQHALIASEIPDQIVVLEEGSPEWLESKAIEMVRNDDAATAVTYLEKYIKATGDFEILERSVFEPIKRTTPFSDLKNRYGLRFGIPTFFYVYVGLIGFFIAFVLNVRRKTDRIANALISGFVFMHSLFLIHVSLYLTNYTYVEPHTLSMSTMFSLLYGPVLYFYYKRVVQNYTFKRKDLLHLLPTVILIAAFIPVYTLSAEEKLQIMLGTGAYGPHPYLIPVSVCKLISLLLYGLLTLKIYLRNARLKPEGHEKKLRLQRNIMIMHGVYTLSYAVYAFVIVQFIFSGVLFHLQLLAMTFLVIYVGYIAYANPQVLVGIALKPKQAINKYKNSGLTSSFSEELALQLEQLLENDKIYRQNDIKLEMVAEKLGTTRHNASQVINEHFGFNFFELINKYRVEEAMLILKDNKENLNIIDVAYEVGYNNKVTFNKSFKRFSNLTPTQFLKLEGLA